MENSTDLLSYIALGVSLLTPALMWIGRTWFKSWLDNRISTKSAKEIETLKSDLERERQTLNDLRANVLGGLAQRQTMFEHKRLEAITDLWKNVQVADGFRMAPELLREINMDKAISALKRDDNVTQFFSALNVFIPKAADLKEKTLVLEPFVPSDIWVCYTAYTRVIYNAAAQLSALSHGLDAKGMIKTDELISDVQTALPTSKDFLEKNPDVGAYFLVDELRAKLVDAIRAYSDGSEADEAQMTRVISLAQRTDFSAIALSTEVPDVPDSIRVDNPVSG